jgi:hypothetical protein
LHGIGRPSHLVSGESGAGRDRNGQIVLQHLATLRRRLQRKKVSQDAAALGDLVRRAVREFNPVWGLWKATT